MELTKIPFLDLQRITASFQPELGGVVSRVVESGWYLHGRETQAFEDAFANYIGDDLYCVGVANGLDALKLSLMAQASLADEDCKTRWEPNDEVIVPAMTFVATALAVLQAGFRPVMVDVTPNGLLDPELLESAITSRTRAVIPVHLYGQPADMKRIASVARSHGLFILEDAAQAHGTPGVGVYGDAVGFSFYPGKNLGALGDGGAVLSRSERFMARVRALANYGAERKYEHQYKGVNSRLDEIQAALLRLKLGRLDRDNSRRRKIAKAYHCAFQDLPVGLLPEKMQNESVWHIYPLFTDRRNELQKFLAEANIETLVHYPIPLHLQHCLEYCKIHDKAVISQSRQLDYGVFPNAEKIAIEELSLPISPCMTDDEIARIISVVKSFFTEKSIY